ncbi:hypothetical protein BZG82_08630 [Salinivibrio sp. PR5]|nr:hypothetical protein BZG82_08630 [Salinivibrio sp. PR5]OOF32085.1 hypothetical protein BZJ20_02805 [Salinivibrio proteolyticus]
MRILPENVAYFEHRFGFGRLLHDEIKHQILWLRQVKFRPFLTLFFEMKVADDKQLNFKFRWLE